MDGPVYQDQAEQDKLYHCLYACVKLLPFSRRPALHIFVPHSFPTARADLGPHLWWLLFPSSLPQREEKSLLRTTAGRTEPGLVSFSQTSTIPLPTSRRHFPLPKLPVSYTALLSPRLPIPSITAHTTCVLPVISGCKREAKLQVGTGSVSFTGEERGEIRPMIKGRVCPGIRFWNKVTGK